MKFGLAGAIPTDGVDMDTSTDHVVGQDGGVLLVHGTRRYYFRALDCLIRRTAFDDL